MHLAYRMSLSHNTFLEGWNLCMSSLTNFEDIPLSELCGRAMSLDGHLVDIFY